MTTTDTSIAEPAMDETDRVLLKHMLLATGRAPDVIEPWLEVKPTMSISAHAGEVVQWLSAFIPNEDEAITWYGTRHLLPDCVLLADNGWTTEQADQLRNEVFIRALGAEPSDHVSDIGEWAATGLPVEFVLLCLENGIASHLVATDIHKAATGQ